MYSGPRPRERRCHALECSRPKPTPMRRGATCTPRAWVSSPANKAAIRILLASAGLKPQHPPSERDHVVGFQTLHASDLTAHA